MYPDTQNLALKFEEKILHGKCRNTSIYWDKRCEIDGKLFSPFIFIGDFTVIDKNLIYNIPIYVIERQIPTYMYKIVRKYTLLSYFLLVKKQDQIVMQVINLDQHEYITHDGPGLLVATLNPKVYKHAQHFNV